MRPHVEIVIEEKKWSKHRGLPRKLRAAALLALRRGGCRNRDVDVSILLADDSQLKRLNTRFRRQAKVTNVLSFAAAGEGLGHLGDLALAYGVCAREAHAQEKAFVDHATHLVVHGVLHLLGFDHQTAGKAAKMEPLEVSILAELGISDPYAARSKPA